MPARRKRENKPKRLAKSAPKASRHARHERGGKDYVGPKYRSHPRRAMGDARNLSALPRLVQSLGEEGIRFQMVGMSAAIVQGVPATTLDTDFWVDLPERQYTRLLNLVVRQGGTPLARTLYALSDGSLVNFIFSMSGLGTFEKEYRHSKEISWRGLRIRVPLPRILRSKRASGRDKDIAHLPWIQRTIRGLQHATTTAKGKGKK